MTIFGGAVVTVCALAWTVISAVAARHGGTYIVAFPLFVVGLSMIGRGYTQKKRDRRADRPHYTQPPEWYPDPRDPAMLRWWDGHAWTSETRAP